MVALAIGLDHPNRTEHLLGRRCQIAFTSALLLGGDFDLPGKVMRNHRHQRNNQRCHQSNLPGLIEEIDQGAGQDQQAADDVREGADNKIFHLAYIARNAGQDVTGAALVVKGQGEPLQMFVERRPQVITEGAPDLGQVDFRQRIAKAVDHGHANDAYRQQHNGGDERWQEVRPAQVGQQIDPIPLEVVDHIGQRIGFKDRSPRFGNQHQERHDKEALLTGQKAAKELQDVAQGIALWCFDFVSRLSLLCESVLPCDAHKAILPRVVLCCWCMTYCRCSMRGKRQSFSVNRAAFPINLLVWWIDWDIDEVEG